MCIYVAVECGMRQCAMLQNMDNEIVIDVQQVVMKAAS